MYLRLSIKQSLWANGSLSVNPYLPDTGVKVTSVRKSALVPLVSWYRNNRLQASPMRGLSDMHNLEADVFTLKAPEELMAPVVNDCRLKMKRWIYDKPNENKCD